MANMFKKCKANKLLSGKETAECWFCRIKTQYALTDKQGGEVKGWANSISIVKMAKKRNFENCQICNNPFIFNDKYGMYYCEHCKFGGGLKKFAELLSKKNFNEVSNG